MSSTLYSPLGSSAARSVALAPRTSDLRGARIGLLDNSKPNADRLLDALEALLEVALQPSEVVRRAKPTMSVPGPDALLDELAASCDAVVVAIGD